jgi:hypothetical protein
MSLPRAIHPLIGALALAVFACDPAAHSPARAPAPKPKAKTTEIGKNVLLEVAGADRRVIVKSLVVLREGPLEGLLTRTMAKEHEYILATDSDARHIHLALTLAGAKPGLPVVVVPNYVPPRGDRIKVSLRYKKDGKVVTVPARDWVRDHKTKKALDRDWVFAGSRFVPPAVAGNPPFYAANVGDLICLCNMESALLDLPIKSPKPFAERFYEPHADRIPPKDTPVDVILEVVPEKKGKK